MSTATFLAKQGMDYSVAKIQATDPNGQSIKNQFHLMRDSDHKVVSRKTVSNRYVPMDPRKMILPLSYFLSEGWINPDKGFLFRNDSYEVLSFEMPSSNLPDNGNLGTDEMKHWLSLHNHHGGGGAVRGSIHSFRPRCLNECMRAARMADFSLPHFAGVEDAYALSVEQWEGLRNAIKQSSERYSIWQQTDIKPVAADELIEKIYDIKPGEAKLNKDGTERQSPLATELEFAIREFSNPRRGTMGQTLADVYNAITATTTHYKPRKSKEGDAKRMASFFDPMGSRNKLEVRAIELIEELATTS